MPQQREQGRVVTSLSSLSPAVACSYALGKCSLLLAGNWRQPYWCHQVIGGGPDSSKQHHRGAAAAAEADRPQTHVHVSWRQLYDHLQHCCSGHAAQLASYLGAVSTCRAEAAGASNGVCRWWCLGAHCLLAAALFAVLLVCQSVRVGSDNICRAHMQSSSMPELGCTALFNGQATKT